MDYRFASMDLYRFWPLQPTVDTLKKKNKLQNRLAIRLVFINHFMNCEWQPQMPIDADDSIWKQRLFQCVIAVTAGRDCAFVFVYIFFASFSNEFRPFEWPSALVFFLHFTPNVHLFIYWMLALFIFLIYSFSQVSTVTLNIYTD